MALGSWAAGAIFGVGEAWENARGRGRDKRHVFAGGLARRRAGGGR